MNTSQLQCCIKCDYTMRNKVQVVAADQLPDTLTSLPCGFIANTDIATKAGSHWCAFYFDPVGNGEFFDSYGKAPQFYNIHFLNFFNHHARKGKKVNNKRIQGDFSSVCGLYSLLYLKRRLNNVPMNEIIKPFSQTAFTQNDQYIYMYISQSFPNCIKNDCVFNQTCKPLLSKPL